MKLFLVLAFVLGSGVAAIASLGAKPAFACQIDPNWDPVTNADLIVYGRPLGYGTAPASRAASVSSVDFKFAVRQVLKGTADSDIIVASTELPPSGTPVMCPQFDRDAFSERPGVFAFERDDAGRLKTSRLSAWFEGDPAVRPGQAQLAALLQQAGPIPAITATPAIGNCQQPFILRGTGFPPSSQVALIVATDLNGPPTLLANVADDGTFATPIPMVLIPCATGGVVAVAISGEAGATPKVLASFRVLGPPGAPDTGNGSPPPATLTAHRGQPAPVTLALYALLLAAPLYAAASIWAHRFHAPRS